LLQTPYIRKIHRCT